MKHRQRLRVIAIALLGLAAMACTCSAPKLGGAGPAPKATVPVSKEAAAQMQKKIDQAAAQAKSTGQFQVTLTESELTSYIDQQIKERQAQGDEIPIANPQVKLDAGPGLGLWRLRQRSIQGQWAGCRVAQDSGRPT